MRVQPRASRRRVALEEGRIKVWTTAPPVEGEANEAVCRLLSERLGIPARDIQIVKGRSSRNKVVRVTGISLAAALEILASNTP